MTATELLRFGEGAEQPASDFAPRLEAALVFASRLLQDEEVAQSLISPAPEVSEQNVTVCKVATPSIPARRSR